MTLEEIVTDYIRTQRPYTGEDMMDFAFTMVSRWGIAQPYVRYLAK